MYSAKLQYSEDARFPAAGQKDPVKLYYSLLLES